MAETTRTPTVVFDFSRTLSGISKSHVTGIDRVERAYISYLLQGDNPVLFLARFKRQAVLLDRNGMRAVWEIVEAGGPWDRLDMISRIILSQRADVARIRKTVRRFSLSWPFLGRGLKAHAPAGFTYLNVGHGKLSPRLWPTLRRSGVGKIVAMVHDLIPIDYPQYNTAKSAKNFEKQMRKLVQHADHFIYNSSDTEQRMQHWLEKWGTRVPGDAVLLGTDPLPMDHDRATPSMSPYFVCVGTIEPRKNHRLLLDIWAKFEETLPASEIPHLHIIGKRGWLNEDVFHMLDTAIFMGKTVFEHSNLSDHELATLLHGAKASLFPSFAEGFGYPLVESLQMGKPVICSDLACFHEIAGKAPIYIDTKKQLDWREMILEIAKSNSPPSGFVKNIPKFPNWDSHFHRIATILEDIQ